MNSNIGSESPENLALLTVFPYLRYHFLEIGLSVTLKNTMGTSTVQQYLFEFYLYMNKLVS